MPALTADDVERLEAVFERHLDVGLHHGAQLAVYVDGDLRVNLAGGRTGPDGEATTPDSRHLLFSCTKPFVGAVVHQLVEAERLAYDDRLVEYWPTFADEGEPKAEITVRQVLCHTAGIPVGELDAKPWLWDDWDEVVAAMEAIDPLFEPGTKPAYHSLNFGWLLGELIRRITGDPVGDVVAERVFDPLGMDRTAIGLDEGDPREEDAGEGDAGEGEALEEDAREGDADADADPVATLTGFEAFDRCRDPGEGVGMTAPQYADVFNDPQVHRAMVPAATGIGTARDVARFYACLANGGTLDGADLLAPETVDHMTQTHAETDDDGTISRPARYGLGVWTGGLANDMFGTVSSERQFGHAGLGSCFGWADPRDDVAFAYVTNGIREESFEHPARVNALTDAVRLLLAED